MGGGILLVTIARQLEVEHTAEHKDSRVRAPYTHAHLWLQSVSINK